VGKNRIGATGRQRNQKWNHQQQNGRKPALTPVGKLWHDFHGYRRDTPATKHETRSHVN
jgi:hypothetical protein